MKPFNLIKLLAISSLLCSTLAKEHEGETFLKEVLDPIKNKNRQVRGVGFCKEDQYAFFNAPYYALGVFDWNNNRGFFTRIYNDDVIRIKSGTDFLKYVCNGKPDCDKFELQDVYMSMFTRGGVCIISVSRFKEESVALFDFPDFKKIESAEKPLVGTPISIFEKDLSFAYQITGAGCSIFKDESSCQTALNEYEATKFSFVPKGKLSDENKNALKGQLDGTFKFAFFVSGHGYVFVDGKGDIYFAPVTKEEINYNGDPVSILPFPKDRFMMLWRDANMTTLFDQNMYCTKAQMKMYKVAGVIGLLVCFLCCVLGCYSAWGVAKLWRGGKLDESPLPVVKGFGSYLKRKSQALKDSSSEKANKPENSTSGNTKLDKMPPTQTPLQASSSGKTTTEPGKTIS